MSSSSRVDPAAAEDAPAPAAAAAESYDAQLAAMKSMRARGASADEMRAAAAKLNHLKRALFVPRYTSSRKTTKLEKSSSTPRRRAMQGPRVRCPACGHDVKASHPDQFRHHVAKCCPDAVRVVPKDAWTDPAVAADAMATRESTLAEEAKLLAYGPEKLASLDDVAAALELTPRRLRLLLRRASLAVPLVADEERLEVIHEDDAILVVNKPPGLRFHPVHRFEGNSLLSRCIGHIRRRRRRRRRASDDGGEDGGEDADADGEEKVDDDEDAHADDMPHIVHRLDMDTSGVCVFVKDKSLVDGFARQFRGDDAGVKKEYVALAVGTVPRGEVVAFSSEAEEVRDDDAAAAAAAAAAAVGRDGVRCGALEQVLHHRVLVELGLARGHRQRPLVEDAALGPQPRAAWPAHDCRAEASPTQAFVVRACSQAPGARACGSRARSGALWNSALTTRAPGCSCAVRAGRSRAFKSGSRNTYTTVASVMLTSNRSSVSTFTRCGWSPATLSMRSSACAARSGSFSTQTADAPSFTASVATLPSPQPSS